MQVMFPGLISLGFVTGCWIDSWEIRNVIVSRPLTMSTPPDDKRSLRKQLKQKLRSAFLVTESRNLDVPDAGSTNTSGATTPFSVSSAHSNKSRVHLVQETDIVIPNPTAQGVTGIGEPISHMCFDQALNPPHKSWIQCGCSCAYKLSTSRQYPRKSYVKNINGRRCVLDLRILPKP